MKKLLLVFLLTVYSVAAFSFDVPPLSGRVIDNAGVLSTSEKRSLDIEIQNFENNTGGQLVVAILKQLDGISIEEAGIQMADKWKIGEKGKDNGIILILSMQEHAMRVEVGYGWEGCVTDARAGDVIRYMKPYFQKSQYFSGISGGIQKLQTYITGISSDEKTQMSSGEFAFCIDDNSPGAIPPKKKRMIEKVSKEIFDSCELKLYFLALSGADSHTAEYIEKLQSQENSVVVFWDTSLTGENDLHDAVKILFSVDTHPIYDEKEITRIIEEWGKSYWRDKDYFYAAYCIYLETAYDLGIQNDIEFSKSVNQILEEHSPYKSMIVWGIAVLYLFIMIFCKLGFVPIPFGFLFGGFLGNGGHFSGGGGGSHSGGGGRFGGGGASGKW